MAFIDLSKAFDTVRQLTLWLWKIHTWEIWVSWKASQFSIYPSQWHEGFSASWWSVRRWHWSEYWHEARMSDSTYAFLHIPVCSAPPICQTGPNLTTTSMTYLTPVASKPRQKSQRPQRVSSSAQMTMQLWPTVKKTVIDAFNSGFNLHLAEYKKGTSTVTSHNLKPPADKCLRYCSQQMDKNWNKLIPSIILGAVTRPVLTSDAKITRRIPAAGTVVGKLPTHVFNNKHIYRWTRMRVFEAVVLPALLHGSETWEPTTV